MIEPLRRKGRKEERKDLFFHLPGFLQVKKQISSLRVLGVVAV